MKNKPSGQLLCWVVALLLCPIAMAQNYVDPDSGHAQLRSLLYSGDLTNPQTPSKDDQ